MADLSYACDAGLSTVPNRLHKVWLGRTGRCPPLRDLVSLLTAKLLLAPDTIDYHVLHDFPEHCVMPGASSSEAPLNLTACWAGLGVRIHRLNFSDPHLPLRRAFADMDVWKTRMRNGQLKIAKSVITDLVRAHLLHTVGGVYMDSDVVITSRNVSIWRGCDFAMSMNMGDRLDLLEPAGRTPPPVASHWLLPMATRGALNSAMSFARPGTRFGTAWWERMRPLGWSTSQALEACCVFPSSYAAKHPTVLRGALGVRILPITLPKCRGAAKSTLQALEALRKSPSLLDACTKRASAQDWHAQLDFIASRPGTHALHFAGSRNRATLQTDAIIRWALSRAVGEAGGESTLGSEVRSCVQLARRWQERPNTDRLADMYGFRSAFKYAVSPRSGNK